MQAQRCEGAFAGWLLHGLVRACQADVSVQWLQTKEEWDRERVFLAEMGYLPDDADPEVHLPACLRAAPLQACVLL